LTDRLLVIVNVCGFANGPPPAPLSVHVVAHALELVSVTTEPAGKVWKQLNCPCEHENPFVPVTLSPACWNVSPMKTCRVTNDGPSGGAGANGATVPVKFAVTVSSPTTVAMQGLPCPSQAAPLQPVKVVPLLGVAQSVVFAPVSYGLVQADGQSM
jgi:hypothetical protein